MLAIINVQRSNDKALDEVKEDFMIITKKKNTHQTLRAYQKSHDEMKSEMRDKASAALN